MTGSSEGAAAHGVAHLGSSLQQTGVKVEDISGVSLATGGTSQQQRHLPVGHGLLGQVVEDDDGVHAVVPEVLSHGHTRVGSQVLQGSSIRGGGGHHDGVLESISIVQPLDNLGHGGSLLSHGNVDAVQHLLLVAGLVESLLVDDGVDGDSSLASLTISNDQLTLTTANGHQAVHSLDPGLHGDDAGGLQPNPVSVLAGDGTLAVNGVAKSINNTAEDLSADGNIHDSSGSLDDISLLDELVVTEDDDTNIVGLQVESHPLQSGAEFNHLLGLDVLEAIDTGDTVSDGEDTAGLLEVDGGGGGQNSLLQDGGDLSSSGLGGINLGGGRQLACIHGDGGDLL